MKPHVKVGDEVMVTVGSDEIRGKKGRVLKIDAKKNRVVVEGVRKITKAFPKSEKHPDGGLFQIDGSVHISNVKKLG